MSGYSKLRRKNPRKMRSLPPEVRAHNARVDEARRDERNTQRRAATMFQYKQLLMAKTADELHELASARNVRGRSTMNKEQLALALLQKGWTP